MDKQLDIYFNHSVTAPPPTISEQKIQRVLEAQKKRFLMIAMSVAALLWAMVVVVLSVRLHQFYPLTAYIIAGFISVEYISSGIFSGIVLKYKKAGA